MSEESLFQEALSRSPAERAAFLDAACPGQPALRAAVEALLAAHGLSGNVLDKPPGDLAQAVDSDEGEAQAVFTGEYTPQPEVGHPAALAARLASPARLAGHVPDGGDERVEEAGIVALAGDAAQVVVHFVRVTTEEIGRLGDPQLAKIGGDGGADVGDVFESSDISASRFSLGL